mmetsp:Transcript_245/g.822  ORF Transcript_245/g.822 Transcript_245/m.822 type:complete len:252 (+) Transcript_245:909-1664(+)
MRLSLSDRVYSDFSWGLFSDSKSTWWTDCDVVTITGVEFTTVVVASVLTLSVVSSSVEVVALTPVCGVVVTTLRVFVLAPLVVGVPVVVVAVVLVAVVVVVVEVMLVVAVVMVAVVCVNVVVVSGAVLAAATEVAGWVDDDPVPGSFRSEYVSSLVVVRSWTLADDRMVHVRVLDMTTPRHAGFTEQCVMHVTGSRNAKCSSVFVSSTRRWKKLSSTVGPTSVAKSKSYSAGTGTFWAAQSSVGAAHRNVP